MSRKQPEYPFVPKSNAYLLPGHFFAIRLSDGRFGAGQVLSVPTEKTAPHSSVGTKDVVLGLLDWTGTSAPNEEQVGGRRVLDWGFAHVKTISQLEGGTILGRVPVDGRDDDDYLKVSHRGGGDVGLYRLGVVVRTATTAETRTMPSMGTWGYGFLSLRAERVFVEGLAIVHAPPVNLAAVAARLRAAEDSSARRSGEPCQPRYTQHER